MMISFNALALTPSFAIASGFFSMTYFAASAMIASLTCPPMWMTPAFARANRTALAAD
ncbi:hypothetical protein D3C86_2212310 [compost metagenome]